MGKTSRTKGNAFERQVAAMFVEAYGLTFRRTPLSGGWAKDADVAQGDIVCIDDPDFPYCIECKKAEGWKLESLFTDRHAWFDNWWQQAVDECPEGKEPLLVFSRNRMPIFVASYYRGTLTGSGVPMLEFINNDNTRWLLVMLLEDFFVQDNKEIPDIPSG